MSYLANVDVDVVNPDTLILLASISYLIRLPSPSRSIRLLQRDVDTTKKSLISYRRSLTKYDGPLLVEP